MNGLTIVNEAVMILFNLWKVKKETQKFSSRKHCQICSINKVVIRSDFTVFKLCDHKVFPQLWCEPITGATHS